MLTVPEGHVFGSGSFLSSPLTDTRSQKKHLCALQHMPCQERLLNAQHTQMHTDCVTLPCTCTH